MFKNKINHLRNVNFLFVSIAIFVFTVSLSSGHVFSEENNNDFSSGAVISELMKRMVTIIKKDKLLYTKDVNAGVKFVEKEMTPYFNMERMLELIMGSHWHNVNSYQHEVIIEEFKKLLLSSYSGTLLPYLSVVPEMQVSKKTTDTKSSVKLKLKNAENESLTTILKLEKKLGKWKIVDLYIEGVSLVATYKGQFANEINKAGINGLIEFLITENKKVQKNTESKGKDPAGAVSKIH